MSNENSNDNSNDNANENANENTNENTNKTSNENITFFLEEKDNNKKDNDEIQKMMDELNEHINASELTPWVINNDDDIDEDINPFFETLYQDYTIKDLLKIYNYYGIKTHAKSKLKKQQIIHTLIYFESLPENFEIVQKRYRMWAYITELLNDPKMKKFIIFS